MRLVPLAICWSLALAQTPATAPDKCRVEGRVVDSVTGQPVPRVRVTLRVTQSGNPPGFTATSGGAAPALPAGAAAPAAGRGAGSATAAAAAPASLQGTVNDMMMTTMTRASSGVTPGAQPAAANSTSFSAMATLPPLSSPGSTAGPRPISVATDTDGRFVFANVDPASYQISAQRDNFQSASQRRPEPLDLKAGDEKRDIVLRMAPLGAITGHIRNEDGDPVQNLQVAMLTYAYGASGRQLSSRDTAMTNDLGEYRFFGAVPGQYFLRASPTRRPADEDETYATSYYPGAADPSGAAVVDLRAGQEAQGIDFMVRKAHAATIRGRVVKPLGAASLTIGLSQTTDNGSSMTSFSLNDPEGKFEFRGLSAGSYVVTAQGSIPDAAGVRSTYSARYPLQMGVNDVEGIELRLVAPLSLSGQLRIEGGADVKPPQVRVGLEGRAGRSVSTAAVRIMSSSSSGGSPIATQGGMGDDGAFTITNIDPDLYRVTVTVPSGLYLKSARYGNADALEAGIDLTSGGGGELVVVVSANGGQVDGNVQDANSKPVPSAQVTLVALDSRHASDYFKSATTDATGHFTIAGIAPGSYKLQAWDEVDLNVARYDPDFVKPSQSQGETIRIAEGDRTAATLKLIVKPGDQ